MKYLIYTIIALAIVLIGYNLGVLEWDNLLAGDSGKALIGILASLAVILVMIILLIARKIAKKKG